MTKLILILILSAGFSRLKAQQLLQLKPDLKLSDSFNYFKPNTGISPNQLLVQPKFNERMNNSTLPGTQGNTTIVYSNMPVLKVQSNDRMPVARLGQDGVNYTMLVKKIKVINPADQAQALTP